MIDFIFGEKKRMSYEQFKKITEEVSSEMFLSVMVLIQTSLPCSENFYRYKKNYEKLMKTESSPTQTANKKIASPKLLTKFQAINSMIDKMHL